MTTHIDVLPFTAATEVAVTTPHHLTDYLDRLDDTTLAKLRAVGDFVARAAAAVQGHRRFAQLWQEAAPAGITVDDADELAALLADLPPAIDGGGRHATAEDAPPIPPTVPPTVAEPAPAEQAAPAGPEVDGEQDGVTTVTVPADVVAAAVADTRTGPWPTESETAAMPGDHEQVASQPGADHG